MVRCLAAGSAKSKARPFPTLSNRCFPLFLSPQLQAVMLLEEGFLPPLGSQVFEGLDLAAGSMVSACPFGLIQTFMEQEPRRVAAYVWECLEYRRTEAPDLIPYVQGRS